MKKVFYDHWKIVFAVLLTSGLAGGFTWIDGFREFIVDKNVIIAWAAFTLLLGYIGVGRYKESRKSPGVAIVSRRANYRHEEYDPVEHEGVKWQFWRGNNVPSAFNYGLGDTPLMTYVDGPFCAIDNCMFELERKSNKWICRNGHKSVTIPRYLRESPSKIMVKKFDAELRSASNKGSADEN